MPRVTAHSLALRLGSNVGLELILSFNGMYRGSSFMATLLLVEPGTL